MTPAEITAKLIMINRLTADELRGWWGQVYGEHTGRNPFDGERAALLTRARELKITLGE